MTLRCLVVAVALSAQAAGMAGAHEFKLGDLTIDHPYAIATAATAKTGAGYLAITNGGSESDTLVAVRADFPRVMLHGTEVDTDGVARMSHVEAIEIPAGETVTLAPRGLHVMFMGLDGPFEEGEAIPAILVFEKAGEVPVEFHVESRGATPEADHDAGHHEDRSMAPSRGEASAVAVLKPMRIR
jgi:hypothetical protein